MLKANHFVSSISSFLLVCTCIVSAYAAKAQVEVQHAHDNAIYKIGEEVSWTISAKNFEAQVLKNATYSIERGGKELIKKGTIDLNEAQTLTTSLDRPGSLLLSVTITLPNKKRPYVKRSGALIDPDNIKASMPKPDDFDAFWQKKLAEQEQVPMNPQLTPEKSYRDDVNSWTITLDTIRDQKIQGRFCRPKTDGKYPALLIVQWAGVYGLDPNWSVHQAAKGFIVLNTLAHDQPVDKDKAFYQALGKGALKGYAHIGNNDREQSYFLRMNLACSRAVDYLSERDDWDGKHILVTGGSQGGYQAIVAAGLNKKVTAIMASVPAGCDHTSLKADRAIGWPYWMSGDAENKDKIEASRYFDAVNFAHNITCPALIGFGMGDVTSRVEGILTAVHAMQGPVVTDITPNREHNAGSFKHYYGTSEKWKKAVLEGKPIPIQ